VGYSQTLKSYNIFRYPFQNTNEKQGAKDTSLSNSDVSEIEEQPCNVSKAEDYTVLIETSIYDFTIWRWIKGVFWKIVFIPGREVNGDTY
jgi:hypothetical protein